MTTVGPYTEHGTLLVGACAQAGVDYVDLSGEPFWQREVRRNVRPCYHNLSR